MPIRRPVLPCALALLALAACGPETPPAASAPGTPSRVAFQPAPAGAAPGEAVLLYPWLPHTGEDHALCRALLRSGTAGPVPLWPLRKDAEKVEAALAAGDVDAACTAAMHGYDLPASDRLRAALKASGAAIPRDRPALAAPRGAACPAGPAAVLPLETAGGEAAMARAAAGWRRAAAGCGPQG